MQNSRHRFVGLSFVAFLVVSGMLINPVIAAPISPAEVETQSKEVFVNVMSPFCEGRTLNDCPSSQAQKLKDEIRAELSMGKGAQTVMDEIFVKYGESYRAAPKASGFGLLAWIVPFAAFLVGGAFLLAFLWRNSKSTGKP